MQNSHSLLLSSSVSKDFLEMVFYLPLDGAVVASYPWDHYTVNKLLLSLMVDDDPCEQDYNDENEEEKMLVMMII